MKQLEVELKVLDIDLPRLIVNLERAGATRLKQKTIFDIYYEKKTGASLKNENKGMRIRHMGGDKIVTMKERMTDKTATVKQAIEEEYFVGEGCEKTMLDKRGLEPSWTKWKKRITYTYKDMQFDIDMYPGIPPVLEIEAPTEKKISKWIKKLGLEEKDQSVGGTRGLFRRYGKTPLPAISQ